MSKEPEEIDDYLIIKAMRQFGGSFSCALAEAATYADSENIRRIKETWPEEWCYYARMARQWRENEKKK